MRLTNDLRDKIKDAVVDRAFATRKRDLDKREKALALEVYRCHVPESLEREIDKFAEKWREQIEGTLFDGEHAHMIRHTKAVQVSVPAGWRSLFNHNYSHRLLMDHFHPWHHTSDRIGVGKDHPMAEDCAAFMDELGQLRHDIKQRTAEVKTALASFTTVKALRAGWPEVMPIADPIIEAVIPKKAVPAIPRDKLNEALDLPPSKELEAA